MQERNFDGMQVLFVEDDAIVRKGAKQALELAGLSVIPCATAEEALAHLSPEFPGILISDVKLPGIDGLELLRIAVAQDPSLPVILVTGHGDVSMAVGAMRQGAAISTASVEVARKFLIRNLECIVVSCYGFIACAACATFLLHRIDTVRCPVTRASSMPISGNLEIRA